MPPINPGLAQRIKDLVKQELFPEGLVAPPESPEEPLGLPATTYGLKLARIQMAAVKQRLLWMQYDGQWRHVAPFSFRYRARNSSLPLLMARCELHWSDEHGSPKIEAFRLDRIQDIYVTDKPYDAVWTIEI